MTKAPDKWHAILGILLLLGMTFRLTLRDPGAGPAAQGPTPGAKAPRPARGPARRETSLRANKAPGLRTEVTPIGSLPPQPREPLRDGQAVLVRIDPSTASAAELETLPGVGPALARRIVEDREQRGNFASLGELQRVRGIGPALARRLAPHVTFGESGRPSVVTSGAEGSVRIGARQSRPAHSRTPPD